MALCAQLAAGSTGAWAQATGQILGRVVEAETRNPLATAEIGVEGTEQGTLSAERGEFILTAVAAGVRTLRVTRLGFRTARVEVRVRAGRTTQLTIELEPAPLEVEGVTAEVERLRLIEPEVVESNEIVLGRELRELPLDEIEEAVELTTGVADGHFRGGRVGQQSYRIDGLEVRNQLESATQGPGLELAPSAIEEVEVVTGGFGAANGSALSGVVSYVTRRGNTERWDGRATLLSDGWVPTDVFRGFSSFSASLGGPAGFLGEGSTLFADLLAQGYLDADPRARGLTCLRPEDGDRELGEAIEGLALDPATRHLYCPYTASRLPYQRGDKLIGFLRIDRPLAAGANLTLSLLHNRLQRELYTPEFKYNPDYQLGQSTKGYLGNLSLDWTRHRRGRVYHVVARAAAMRLDRYLGVIDPWTFDGRARLAGFGAADFRFLGEDFARSPIERQLAGGGAVPGYAPPGGRTGSPFGPAAAGIFFTQGTPGLANWSRSEFLGGDLFVEALTARGHALRAGASARLYRVESYERTQAYLPGSSPNYARFYPAAANGFFEASMLAAHDITVQLGLRVEGFRSGLNLQADRSDLGAPAVETSWKIYLMPRVGVAAPLPGSDERTMFRFSYGLVAQPPDFSFFLDTTIGDSLRADIRRQGNPNLSFERASAWELGVSHLLSEAIAVDVTLVLKEMENLVTSALTFADYAENQFTTGDFGSVRGLELTARGRWPRLRLRIGYALLSAKGVTSSAFEDPGTGLSERRVEFPLAFDRRHSIDFAAYAGRAAGAPQDRWGVSLTGAVRSGYPLDRTVDDLAGGEVPTVAERLPWTALFNLRVSRVIGSVPGCAGCVWRVVADGRNMLARNNIIALRRDTRSLAPSAAELFAAAAEVPEGLAPIPQESADYSRLIDLNRDGLVTAEEMRTARFAAALDRHDPSLFYGQAFELRLGMEVAF